jgi:hypothetical protein
MERRNIGAAVMVLAISMFLLTGTASAHTVGTAVSSGTGTCHVRSQPGFNAQGEFGTYATVADVVEISCDPHVYGTGAPVTLTAGQLWLRCNRELTWYDANDGGGYIKGSGPSFEVHLDVNGNANVALIAGPKCSVGESLITVDETAPPFETYTTSFQVLPSTATTPGLFMLPAAQVEDAESSGVVTIAEAEFAHAGEESVRLQYEQLTDRCQAGPGSILVKENREEVYGGEEVLEAIKLDNSGNGFAVIVGSDSCLEGKSLIEADTELGVVTQTADFTVEGPMPERF